MAGSQNTSAKATAEVPLEERDEFIAPRTILKPLLKAYEIVLVLVQQYKNLERARNPKHTLRFLGCLPLVIVGIYYFGISDTFVAWVFSNYLILAPSWPAVKSTLKVVPKPILEAFKTFKRLIVPRFLRSHIF